MISKLLLFDKHSLRLEAYRFWRLFERPFTVLTKKGGTPL